MHRTAVLEALALVPPDGVVSAQSGLLPRLSQRQSRSSFPATAAPASGSWWTLGPSAVRTGRARARAARPHRHHLARPAHAAGEHPRDGGGALGRRAVTREKEVQRYLANIRREVARLGHMVDDLFQLSQLDAGVLPLDRRPLALQEVAAEVVDAMQACAASAGVVLTLAIDGNAPPASLDGVNALEHTPRGGSVRVTVGADERCVRLSVADSSEGIEASDLPRVWERRYRVERSRSRATGVNGGAGLGLAIVRGVVEAHGGSVEARSAPGAGATFTLALPL